MTKYKGYEIKPYKTMGNDKIYYEVWKNNTMWGFAARQDDAEIMIDRMIAKKEEAEYEV